MQRALGTHRPLFDLVNYQVVIDRNGGNSERIVATVKIDVEGKAYLTASEGDGPVNALDGALRLALQSAYPEIEEIQLLRLQGAGARTRGERGRRQRCGCSSSPPGRHESGRGTR